MAVDFHSTRQTERATESVVVLRTSKRQFPDLNELRFVRRPPAKSIMVPNFPDHYRPEVIVEIVAGDHPVVCKLEPGPIRHVIGRCILTSLLHNNSNCRGRGELITMEVDLAMNAKRAVDVLNARSDDLELSSLYRKLRERLGASPVPARIVGPTKSEHTYGTR
jgi:hypothetical protein